MIAVHENNSTFYFLKDHLGSTRVVMNSAGNLWSSAYDYTPLGDVTTIAVNKEADYLFTGQEFDQETDLHNFRARMYDSDLGRFYARDRLADKFPGTSPYAYAFNNPTAYVDPSGDSAWLPSRRAVLPSLNDMVSTGLFPERFVRGRAQMLFLNSLAWQAWDSL
jgi:RHS repeat-associated protein